MSVAAIWSSSSTKPPRRTPLEAAVLAGDCGSAPLPFSQAAMGKLAVDFAMTYPNVHLEVTTDDREVDMIEGAHDLVVRVNPQANETLVGRAFLHDRLGVVASPSSVLPTDYRPVPAVMRGTNDGQGVEDQGQ